MKNLEIITNRLILTNTDYKYQEDIFREFTFKVAKYLIPQPSTKFEDTVSFIAEAIENNQKGVDLELVVLDKRDRSFIGCIGLHEINTEKPSFGIWLKESAWGLGYGKEAVFALKNWADLNLEYLEISYSVSKENTASRKIVESLGAEIFLEITKKNQSGINMDSIEYRIKGNKN